MAANWKPSPASSESSRDDKTGRLLARLGTCDFDVDQATFIDWYAQRRAKEHSHEDIYHLDWFSGQGSLFLPGREVPLRQHTILVIPPGTTHGFAAADTGRLKNLCVKFRTSDALAKDLEPIVIQPATGNLSRRVEDLMCLVLEEWQLEEPGGSVIMSSLIRVLLVDILREWNRARSSGDQGIVQDACRYMAVQYSKPLVISELAANFGLRPDSFCRLFTRWMKQSPKSYLLDLRLKQACVLLRAGYRISDIAERTGFSSIHYFSRLFRQRFSTSPSSWRRDED